MAIFNSYVKVPEGSSFLMVMFKLLVNKYESQIGSSSQLLGKIKFMFQTTNQIPCGNKKKHPFGNGYHWLMELRMDYCFTSINYIYKELEGDSSINDYKRRCSMARFDYKRVIVSFMKPNFSCNNTRLFLENIEKNIVQPYRWWISFYSFPAGKHHCVGLVNHEVFTNCPHQSTLQVWEFATSISKPKWVGLKENLLETTNVPGKCDDV